MEHSSHNSSLQPHTQSPIPETQPPQEELVKSSFIGEIIRFSLIALVIVLPVRMFIAQPFIVSGASMETTFSTGEYLIVDQVTYHFDEPQRGDVIIFRYPRDPSKFFIKRVIGVPGDTLDIEGNAITITNSDAPQGVVLEEPYIREMTPGPHLTEKLGAGEYFVMGDNRDASSDSRTWGVLPENNIVGRAYLRLFPLTSVGLLPGSYDTESEITHNNE